ncbi:hypothetical protein FUAX_15680 [Fulvitalea axinellae]|uniref:Uncharacterized protein n=1 Tax=Fulvitalea axinellae TaxID=1182444 RepID=A0AAU9CJQ0_9BACT|nr:hypothetical protein FUAX_15680 [Fulvitalea axinellae]
MTFIYFVLGATVTALATVAMFGSKKMELKPIPVRSNGRNR